MLMIRLQRVARKHIPIFRVVLTDSKNSTKSGKFHEVLGSFNLKTNEKTVDAERVKYWISKGAQPSGTMHNYLVHEKIIAGKKINVLPRRTPIKAKVKAEEKPAQGGSASGGKEEVKAESTIEKAAEAPVAKTE
ncbi:MAG: 30S ribosomal protein S16 [Parcubacteria group bacterium GW2011_GWA2_49_9]|nr:MAG: 30S ribosomal protein S16 [Parcubacteria group bacterium GW2011_GWA2_49_9]